MNPRYWEYVPPYAGRDPVGMARVAMIANVMTCSAPDASGKRHLISFGIKSHPKVSGNLSSAIGGWRELCIQHLAILPELHGMISVEIGQLTKLQSFTAYATCLG